MNAYDIVRLHLQFEAYDKRKKDYSDTPKLQRFYDYLSMLIRVCSGLQTFISRDKGITRNTDYITYNEHEIDNISKAANYIIRLEKRQAAAART